MGIRDSVDLAMQDWLGTAGFDRGVDDPAGEDFWARQWATAYVDFAARREAGLAARDGRALVPGGRLGRARRRPGRRARQLGAALPRHLGHRARACSTPFERRVRDAVAHGPGRAAVPAPRRRADVTDGVVDGVRGAVLEPQHGRARHGQLAHRGRRVRAARAGGDRHLRRDRRQPRPRPRQLAVPARARAAEDDLRRARARRRADAGHHRGGRRPRRQPRPDVALHRGHPQLEPDLGAARHPDPAPARRRCGSTPADAGSRRRTSPASTPSRTLEAITASGYDHSWFVLTQKIIEKEFALSGSEQNPDLTGKDLAPAARPRRGPARRRRWRRSRSTAPTSSWPTRCPSWSTG